MSLDTTLFDFSYNKIYQDEGEYNNKILKIF